MGSTVTGTFDAESGVVYFFEDPQDVYRDPRLAQIDRFIADCQARGKAARLRASQLMRGDA